MSGFVRLDRDAFNHHVVGDPARFYAWFWMVSRTCWKPTRFDIHGKTVTLARGQFSSSVREMADAWGWSKSSVERFLTRLKTETMIETSSGTGRLVITICNYDKYQSPDGQGGTDAGTPTGTRAGQQRDIKEQGNKGTSSILDANASSGEVADDDDDRSGASDDDDANGYDLLGEPIRTNPPKPDLKPEHVVEVWNDLAQRLGRPTVRLLTPERRQTLKARIAGYSIDDFTEAIGKVERSPFLRGEKGWKGITFDWFVKKQNFQKILEGNYDS